MTEVANPTLGRIEDAVERYGLATLIEVGFTALFAALPFLRPIGGILRRIVGVLADKLFEFVRLIIDLKVIRLVNDAHQASFEREVLNLRLSAHDHGVNSPEFRKQYEEAHDAFAAFVKFNGA